MTLRQALPPASGQTIDQVYLDDYALTIIDCCCSSNMDHDFDIEDTAQALLAVYPQVGLERCRRAARNAIERIIEMTSQHPERK
jgi:hypothetical protein